MRIDGYEAPIDLVGTLTIGRDTIHVDYTGTSGMSSYAINCPLCYTEAYTTFGVNCVVAPHIPNNTGTLDAVRVTAPEGTILSATHPAAVYARSVMGHMLPDVVYGCLDQALPGRVPAEGTSNLWTLNLIAGHGLTGIGRAAGTPFMVNSFHSGGAGARPKQDGLSATPFPVRRAQRAGRGHRGDHAAGDLAQGTAAGFRRRRTPARRARPGHGDRLARGCGIRHLRALRASEISGERPARRRFGTVRDGYRSNREPNSSRRGLLSCRPVTALSWRCRAVAAWAQPRERDPAAVRRDVRMQYVSRDAAQTEYGVTIAEAGED